MTIQGAMYNATSSMQLLQQQMNVISNNIANANTPGFVQQDLQSQEAVFGGQISGVTGGQLTRLTNAAATATANQANGLQAYSQAMVTGLTPYLQTLGQAADSSSLPSQLAAFQQALGALSSAPSDAAAQTQTLSAAENVVATFHTLDSAVSSAREQADLGIVSAVATVNDTLTQIGQNETQMKVAQANGESTASYMDTRDSLLATLSKNLPIRVFQNTDNSIIVTTDQGTTLYDGQANHLQFTPTPNIPSQVRLNANPALGQSGGLSNVTINGQPIAMSQTGTIAAQMQLRDGTLADFADQLDQLAGNLIGALQSADPTVTNGQTGLFTDNGQALNTSSPVQTAGLAGNIQINTSVDPTQGGQVWRLRDGAQAATQGTGASNAIVLNYLQALQAPQSYSATGLPTSMSATNAAAQIAGVQQATLSTWTARNTDRTQQAQDANTALSNATGVNIDEQMQRLLIVQQTYHASAQVIAAATQMFNDLLQLH